MAPDSITAWYRLSNTLGEFYSALPALDTKRLIELVTADARAAPRARLRTRHELECGARSVVPKTTDLATATAREQTLQWMFIRRGYLAGPHERILARELPTCCAGEKRKGSADLLVYDTEARQPVIVELKQASAGDPITRCVLEVLFHWTFAVQHLTAFEEQLADFEAFPTTPVPRLLIVAPERFFRDGLARSKRRRFDDYATAHSWIEGLRSAGLVQIDLYAIEDDWQTVGPQFRTQRVELAGQ